MVVKGLWKYLCTTNVHFQTLRLSESPKKVLLCDAQPVFLWLIELFHTAKVRGKEYSQYTSIYGGDFNDYAQRIMGFVEALRHVGIQPIFFIGNPVLLGSDPRTVSDCRYFLECIDTYAKICNYDPKTEVNLEYNKKIKKTLLFSEIVKVLQRSGVEVIERRAVHSTMVAYARHHIDEVCGILTNSTEVALMTDCSMIHYKLFDCNGALKLNASVMEVHPREIHCNVLTPQIIASHFRIKESCLPGLSILCGNMFSRYLNYKSGICEKFDTPVPKSVAKFMQQHEAECSSANGFLSIKDIQKVCEEYPEYSVVTKQSFEFYDDTNHHTYDDQIKEASHFVLSVKSGDVWRNEIEQLDRKLPCIYEATQPVRELMYRLLETAEVAEFGQCVDRLAVCRVMVVPFEPAVLSGLKSLSRIEKLFFVFHSLCEFKIPAGDIRIPTTFDCPINAAFTCSCLMFALKNRLVAAEYLTPLLLACFSCALGRMPPQSGSRPGPTGVTIAAQFMVVLQHAQWLASLVGFEETEFPLPSTIFQPFVYIPLHDTAFKISQKAKFRGESAEASREYYDSISRNKAFVNFRACICNEGTDPQSFMHIVEMFKGTIHSLETKKTKAIKGHVKPATGATKRKHRKK